VRICADDFGLSDSVNAGVVTLVQEGRLDAVSCMANAPAFASGAEALRRAVAAAPRPVEIGLHVNLTANAPLGPMPHTMPGGRPPTIGRLLAKGLARQLALGEIAMEIARQARRFRAVLGHGPQFLDGHEHVHLVPGVSRALYASRAAWAKDDPWIRRCDCPPAHLARLPASRAKAALLTALSARFTLPGAWRHNPWFYGVNDFRTDRSYDDLMDGWLRLASARPEGALIMVHPASPQQASSRHDPIAARRAQEFAYLSSPAFAMRRCAS